MSEQREGIKVTASDALEFEPVAPKLKKAGSALKTVLFIVLAVGGGAAGWAYYGDRILSIVGDGSSDVPVIRAELGPLKVRPASPGGLQVPDRDKLVYNRMRPNGTDEGEAPPVERLLPMPENPITQPLKASSGAASTQITQQSDQSSGDRENKTPLNSVSNSAISTPPAKPKHINETPRVTDVTQAEKPKVAPPAPPVPEVAKKPAPTAQNLQPKSSGKTAPPPSPKIAKSTAQATTPKAPTVPSKPVASTPSAAPAVSSKSYRVQLAAARTPAAARGEWDKLRRKHLDLLGDLGLTVTKVDLGATKGVFYRLRVGPLKDRPAAKALCKDLAKRKVSCLVVRPGK
jgi:hypothetical protein